MITITTTEMIIISLMAIAICFGISRLSDDTIKKIGDKIL